MFPKRKPSPFPHAMLPGDFAVRVNGTLVLSKRAERTAWEAFVDACKGLGDVELLRGAKVVAQRKERTI